MKISRRTFIRTSIVATAFAGTALSVPASSLGQKKILADDLTIIGPLGDPLLNKTAEDFRQYIGAEFLVLTTGKVTSAILSKVTETAAAAGTKAQLVKRLNQPPQVNSKVQNFILSFQMLTDEFPQATYQLWHPDFGQFDLFMVPGKRSTPFLLHAVINRR